MHVFFTLWGRNYYKSGKDYDALLGTRKDDVLISKVRMREEPTGSQHKI